MNQDDLFIPPLAQFRVKSMPSGRVRYVISPSFAGAARTAKDVQIRGQHDREFYPRFERWCRGYGEPKRTGEPPPDYVYPEYMFDPEYNKPRTDASLNEDSVAGLVGEE
jgi:hypothetical protein